MKIIYALVLILFSVFLSILISKMVISKTKSNIIFSNTNFHAKFFQIEKFKKIKNSLNILNNPYGLNFKKFFLIKYVLSTFVLIFIFFRTNNLIISIIYFFIIFFIPEILLKSFERNESIKLVKDIKNLNNNLTLLLSSNTTFYEALKICEKSIKYKRFRDEFSVFVKDYSLFNFNLQSAISRFKLKFSSNEFDMFINIMIQGDKEGKMLEMLEVFDSTLELSMYKYIKKTERKASMFILFGAIISITNIIIIAVYPMIIQILQNLNIIFY